MLRTLRKFLRRVSRYGKTNLLVALHLCHTVERKHCWKRLFGLALRLTSGLPLTPKRRREMAPYFFRRIAVCRRCPMFNLTYKTCGTPGAVTKHPDGTITSHGCWCIMLLKSWMPDVVCWGREQGMTDDCFWPDHLNNVTVL